MRNSIAARGVFHGSALGILLCVLVIAGSAAVAVAAADPVDSTRMVIRLTARTSLILFAVAFVASSLVTLRPTDGTRWMLTNRRYFGFAFAFSHCVHAAALVVLSRLDPVLFDALTMPASFVFGGLGYAIILAMTVTSIDGIARLVGPRMLQIVHRWGAWFIALFFVVNFGRRAIVAPNMYWPYMLIIFGAIAIRILASSRKPKLDGLPR